MADNATMFWIYIYSSASSECHGILKAVINTPEYDTCESCKESVTIAGFVLGNHVNVIFPNLWIADERQR